MALDCSWFIDSSFIADYIFAMILESALFYIIIVVLGFVWMYLTE